MTKLQYLRHLYDIAYQANLADSAISEAWQTPDMAATHAQPVLDIARSMLTPAQYQAFLDCFGDFASFAALLEEADESAAPPRIKLTTAWGWSGQSV